MAGWSAPPPRCLAAGSASLGPQKRGARAPYVHGGSWRGETRVLKEKMGPATTHADHQPQAALATELPRRMVAGPTAGPRAQHQGVGLVPATW